MSISYLECPDIHANKRWLDTTLEVLETIKQTAIREKVDFITFPGDLHDAEFYVSDSSGYNKFRKKIKELLVICPVVAIEGTPGHEPKGAYSPLEDIGVVLLQPGKVYGFTETYGVYEIRDGDRFSPNCILFGIPELNKNNVQAALHLPAEAANAKTIEFFGNYIDSFIGPMRLKYKDIPAIALLHGNVSDSSKEHSTDIILRSSDIVIHTETLERSGVDRWTLGHIHTPWESTRISAGYAGYPGIDRNPWGKRDFVPAMNMIEIVNYQQEGIPEYGTFKGQLDEFGDHPASDNLINVTRIPYGTPERRKITGSHIREWDSGVAYWLVTKDPEAVLPTGIHPWSRITFAEEITETRRATAAEAEAAKTLWDLFKLFDPDIKAHLKEKIDTIPIKNNVTGKELNVTLADIKVVGCDLFGGKTVKFNLKNLSSGLNQLIGTNGNGDGKSSLLGMCSLYPCVVGKDTKSGRRSALKDFFSGRDSSIEKTAIVNGETHHHLITIKGAHTASPKVECFLDINGIPQLEKATFDTMFEKCEELYGDYEDYLLTTFYEQPQQSKSQRSGLMTATMTEARNLVQNIAGVDREAEKRFSLDKIAVLEKEVQQLESNINALDKYSEDMGDLQKQLSVKTETIKAVKIVLEDVKQEGIKKAADLKAYQTRQANNESLKTKKTGIQEMLNATENAIFLSNNKIKALKKDVLELPANKTALKNDDDAKKLMQEYLTLLNEYNRIMGDYEKLVSDLENVKKDFLREINQNETRISTITKQKNDELALDYSNKKNEYAQAKSDYSMSVIKNQNVKENFQSIIDKSETEKRTSNKEIELRSKPCPECGYIDPATKETIKLLNESISDLDDKIQKAFEDMDKLKPILEPDWIIPVLEKFSDSNETRTLEADIKTLQKKIESFQEIIKPDLIEPIKPMGTITDFERSVISEAIATGLKAEASILHLEEGILNDTTLRDSYQKDFDKIIIDIEIDNLVQNQEQVLEASRSLYSTNLSMVNTLGSEYSFIEGQILKAEREAEQLKSLKKTLTTCENSRNDWNYIASNLNSHKLPAMELDIILDSIDAEATRTIEPFLEGRYSFRTITQVAGKKSTVDRFDIMIHDGETGQSFSMFFTNPGNKAFYSDCYIKSLIRKRNERQMRSYSPIIYDEADGPVNPLRVKAYYEIQQAYFQDEKVLIVSQKDITSAYVEKVFNIEEMKS